LLRRASDGTLVQYLRERRADIRRKRHADEWLELARRHAQIDHRVHGRARIRLHPDSELCRLIYVEDFERVERQFLKAFLAPGDIFVDVGANLGLFSVVAASLVGPEGRVLAFEPCQKAFDRLEENIALNGFVNVDCHRLALADSSDPLPMSVSQDGFDAWNSAARPTAGRIFSTETVAATTWDTFATARGLVGRVAMLKIDVEGWESRVLAGGCESLSRPDAPVLQVEFTEQAAHNAGSSCLALYRAITELGFGLFAYDAANRRLVPDPPREQYPYVNLFAVKDLHRVHARLARCRWPRWRA
jgi:FkbM family methyltransferase